MRHVSQFPRKVVEYEDWGIVMEDGTRLSAGVWMPEDAGENPVPVILEHLPYRKRDGTIVRDQLTHPWFAGHGYCCIRTDMRGNGDSQGLMGDEYTSQELDDACAVIAWAAQQPWCNGNVGMMGISWGGFNGLQVAAMGPPALKAVITLCSTVDRYADDIHYKGGCLLGTNFGWASQMLSYSSRPPDRLLVGEDWQKMWRHRLENQPWDWCNWMAHQRRDAYWKHGSVCEDYSATKAAVLSIGGWHDGYRNTIAHLVDNLEAPVKGIVGPWIHKYPHFAGPQPAIGFLQEARRWWDRWLKGVETGVEAEPDYRVYVMDALPPARWYDERPGHWVGIDRPEDGTLGDVGERCILHLADEGLTADADWAASDLARKVASPPTCGMQSGEYFPFAFGEEFPGEQGPDDEKSLIFDGPVATEDYAIIGAPFVRFRLSCNRAVGQIAVRLCSLDEEGRSALLSHGFLNLTHRNSHEHPQPIEPGEAFDIAFALDQMAHQVPAGHRLRLSVSNAYWPFIWPSPEATALTIHSGSLAFQRHDAPGDDALCFEPPEGAPAWQAEKLRQASYRREVTEAEDGTVTIMIDCDSGMNRDAHHGLILGSSFRSRWSIAPNDPNSARAHVVWEQEGGREGAMWRTRAEAEMTSDVQAFHSTARLETWLNGEPFFDKSFTQSKVRDLV